MPRKKKNPSKRKWESVEPSTIPKLLKSKGMKLDVITTATDYPFKLGIIIITINEDCAVSSDFTVKFDTESTSCFICWEEKDPNVQVMSVPATSEVPFDILQSLCTVKGFIYTANGLQTGDNIIQIYVNPLFFVSLNDASQESYYQGRKGMFKLLKYFLKLEFDEYEDNYLYEEQQVEKIYSVISTNYNPHSLDVSISHDFLITSLRSYQSQAVQWMIKRENPSLKKGDSHVLYITLKFQDGQELYFHKCGGFFVKQKCYPDEPCKGGILADEMGLGKSLEVLACILMNPRSGINAQNQVYAEHAPHCSSKITDRLSSQSKKIKLLCENEQLTGYGNNVCGCIDASADEFADEVTVKCGKCCTIHRTECALYSWFKQTPEVPDYICPNCWHNSSALISSRATLIISPASIIHQWTQEISKHVKKNCMKFFVYGGIIEHKYIDPRLIANNDIVLTTYETLKKELIYADLPNVKDRHSLRHPKKFAAIPSPLVNIEWWRICLDEAQMVEAVSTKSARMIRKLHSINRWCVSGTPIVKSIEDLYGLLLFLGAKPYDVKRWWIEDLWKPHVNGNSANIFKVLNDITWRSTKQQVWDQLRIPELQERIHQVELSPIEIVFYNKEYSRCAKGFNKSARQFDSLDVKLSCIDKKVLSKVLSPLWYVQLACSVVCNIQATADRQRIVMKPQELLQHLLKTAKYECEDVHRKMILALNGLGGIYFLQGNYQKAVDTYERALKSIEDNKKNCRTDITQQIHIFNMLIAVQNQTQSIQNIKINSKFSCSTLDDKIFHLTEEYMEIKGNALITTKSRLAAIKDSIGLIMQNFKMKRRGHPSSAWWYEIIDNLQDRESFLREFQEFLMNAEDKNSSAKKLALKSLRNVPLLSLFDKWISELHQIRKHLRNSMNLIAEEPSKEQLDHAIGCHLRPQLNSETRTSIMHRCIYCETDEVFKGYGKKLFEANEAPSEEESVDLWVARCGTHSDSALELFFKHNLKASNSLGLADCEEDGKNELKLLYLYKKEYKWLRKLWLLRTQHIAKRDEVEMAKIATRFPYENEKLPIPPPSYILFKDEVRSKMLLHESDSTRLKSLFDKKLGHLFYLQHLEKAENKDAPFDEFCPVCRQTLENKWSVLQCGHSICLFCIDALPCVKVNSSNDLEPFTKTGIQCPVCRHFVEQSDVYYIDKSLREENVVFQGYHSKIVAIVKCLIGILKDDPTAKCLVFSIFPEVLANLGSALNRNDINCVGISSKYDFQVNLDRFKNSEICNVLLIPLNFGCSGLNIIEANHVLLVEPVLDSSKHLQAIGRIHRIGQTRKTTVHRFVVSNSIEKNIFNLCSNDNKEFTLQNIKEML